MGRESPGRGIYHGDRDWLRRHNFTWFPSSHFQSRKWHSPGSRNSTSVKLVQKITERVTLPLMVEDVAVATAVFTADQYCEDTQVAGSVIVKIFQRIPNLQIPEGKEYVSPNDLFSHQLPIVEDCPDETPRGYCTERDVLQHLTDHKCIHTPSLIAAFTEHEANPWLKGGFLGFLVIEKLSAVTMSDIWEFSPSSEAQSSEQLIIQERFKDALIDIGNLGVYNMDQGARNLMWNSKLGICYWIDFEQAIMEEPPPTPRTWEQLTSHNRNEFGEFEEWEIIMDFQDAILQEARKSRWRCYT